MATRPNTGYAMWQPKQKARIRRAFWSMNEWPSTTVALLRLRRTLARLGFLLGVVGLVRVVGALGFARPDRRVQCLQRLGAAGDLLRRLRGCVHHRQEHAVDLIGIRHAGRRGQLVVQAVGVFVVLVAVRV